MNQNMPDIKMPEIPNGKKKQVVSK